MMTQAVQRVRSAPDAVAVAGLVLLWLLFFWRLFTPVAADQAAFIPGDFSGQFVTFGGYQYTRMAEGQAPLWNPYNNGGLPFIADPQAAVFYPPRWVTIGLSHLSGGWTYNALQLEAAAHVLLFSLLMYGFVRRLTLNQSGSVLAALTASIIMAYGGFTAGYPPLQLALLESAVWLPLGALGIVEATRRDHLRGQWLLLSGWALGMAWLAGHAQTAFFQTYALSAYLAFRAYTQCLGWHQFISGLVLMGAVTFGVTAVTFLPGVEYLAQATRTDLGFSAKGGGFPLQDMAQMIFPGSVSAWSPLYIGLTGLLLAVAGLWRRTPENVFWAALAGIALLLSFGAQTALYDLFYQTVPGLRFFRGQERAAYLVVMGLAVLAGFGVTVLAGRASSNADNTNSDWMLRPAAGLLAMTAAAAFFAFLGWQGAVGTFGDFVGIASFSLLVMIALYALLRWWKMRPGTLPLLALVGLLIFELFSTNMTTPGTYVDAPGNTLISMTAPPLFQPVIEDADTPFRVDGFRGLGGNYGSLYEIQDIRGISPLFLQGPDHLINAHYTNNPLAWELFAVKYIVSDGERSAYGRVETTVIANGEDTQGAVNLHRVDDPRPFALLIYDVAVVDSDAFAYALMNDPRFDERSSVILHTEPSLPLPESPADPIPAAVTVFEPERIVVEVDTPENAVLSLALVDYPGWQATLNGEPTDIIRAYGGLSAVMIPAGQHTVELIFAPTTYAIGAVLSLLTWLVLPLAAVIVWRRS